MTSRSVDIAILSLAVVAALTMTIPFVSIPLATVTCCASLYRWIRKISRTSLATYGMILSCTVSVVLLSTFVVSLGQ